MVEISVARSDNGYQVVVSEGSTSTSHLVTLSEEDLERFGRGVSGDDLIDGSLRFLLSKEPKESIMREFDISLIPKYFPDYESKIGEFLGNQ